MHDAAFTIFSAVSIWLVLLPLPWHWRAKNVGTLVNIFWLFLGNLSYFVNSVAWRDNYSKSNPVWCDISAKIGQAVGPGIVCSTLCITRRLAIIASSKAAVFDQKRKRNGLIVDLVIGIGIPLLLCACTAISQGHRFDVLEGVGCYAAEYIALPYIFLYVIWPVVISLVSTTYGCYAAYKFLAQRLQFTTILKSSQSGLNTSRFIRLMALAFSDLILTLPLSIYVLVLRVRYLEPWVNWAHVHEDFSRIGAFPASTLYISSELEAQFQLPRWSCCLGACFFFLYFGVTDDALTEYSKWFGRFRTAFSRQSVTPTLPTSQPKLGSTIEAAAPWTPSSDKAPKAQPSLSAVPETLYHMSNTRGMVIAVSVERQVV